jgi:hypothetical protein
MKRARVFQAIAGAAALVVALLVAGCGKKKPEPPAPTVETVREELGTTVIITATGIPNQDHYKVKLSKGVKPNQDHMRWKNDSGQKVTIHFKSGWPFQGTGSGSSSMDIEIEAGALSAWYTISPSASDAATYDYQLTPNLIGTPGPTDPSVSSEP